MTDLFLIAQTTRGEAIRNLADKIALGPIDRRDLNTAMEAIYGATNASGKWTQRDSFELLECALSAHLIADAPPPGQDAVLAAVRLERRLPTQTVRAEDQIELQQFSTPIGLAALALWLANPMETDVVLEPSAGNGLLIAGLGKIREIYLNEIDTRRRANLCELFPDARITELDGALIHVSHAHLTRPTLILMNPPFSRTAGRGADQTAAARHLQAAIRLLAPNGRLVAIMPDWFTPSTSMRAVYETVLKGTTVHTCARLGSAFTKHGTSIATRVYVIDKAPGDINPPTLTAKTVEDLLCDIRRVDRLVAVSETRDRPQPAAKSPGLLGNLKASRPATPLMLPALQQSAKVIELDYIAHDEAMPIADQVGIYLPYRPSRVTIAAAKPHPTALVESVAMGSIPAPKPSYIPTIYDTLLERGTLSTAQIETMIYAGDAWSRYLPGTFVPNKEGVGLTLDPEGRAYRMGYFLGDGTGAGKGRQGAALILDNWLKGRRRHIWITKNEPLLTDCMRDWKDLGGLGADVQPVSQWRIDEPITLPEGILFVTYPTLRSQRQDCSRLKQIVDWAGPDFEGVIWMDESHEMGGVAGGEGPRGVKAGSLQGTAGVLLQHHLPDARVAYASATGASSVENLAYAVRLGLWGPKTAFADRDAFIASIRQGGIAAMELVARDLKATGLYSARALSFDGVEYEILKHDLTPDQIETFNSYCAAWQVIHQNIEEALKLTGVVDELNGSTLNSGAKSAARSRFESTKQRFFGQVLLSMKLPSLIKAIEHDLATSKSAVIQLVSTAESILNRRLDHLNAEERAELEIDLSPLEAIIDYLERAFPTCQMETYLDDTDQVRSRPMYDKQGHPVHNPEALEARAEMIEHICALSPIKPALDAIIDHFGTDAVAEVTGRTKRLVLDQHGRQKLETRSARSGQADALAFMEKRKRILIFSDAGGTGKSYHASLMTPNQEVRRHYMVEPGWRADRAIQGLGRTHRTHQAQPPIFIPVTTNVKGELRFTSTIARRLDSLGALTRGQRQTGGQNLFDPSDNLESEYAKAALIDWYQLLASGRLKSTNLQDFQSHTALEIVDKDGVVVEDLPPIQRYLNRILALPIQLQDKIFDEFLGLIEGRVDAARRAGKLDVGVESIPVENAQVTNDIVLRIDPHSGATSHLLTIDYEMRARPRTIEDALNRADWDLRAEYAVNQKSGRAAVCTRAQSIMTAEGETIRRVCLIRPTRNEYLTETDYEESAWQRVSQPTFKMAWDEEFQEAAERIDHHTGYLATGLLLPIWDKLPADYLAVIRIVDKANGKSWLGRIVQAEDVAKVLAKFDIAADIKLSPTAVIEALGQGKTIEIKSPFAATLRRSMVNGETRFELVGAPSSYRAWLKSLGAFTEIIAYKTRIFLPEAHAKAILSELLA